MKTNIQSASFKPHLINVRSRLDDKGALAVNYYNESKEIEVIFYESWDVISQITKNDVCKLKVSHNRELFSFVIDKSVDITNGTKKIFKLDFNIDTTKPIKWWVITTSQNGLFSALSKQHSLYVGSSQGSYLKLENLPEDDINKLPWEIEIQKDYLALVKLNPDINLLENKNINTNKGLYNLSFRFLFIKEILHQAIIYTLAESNDNEIDCQYTLKLFASIKKITKLDYPDGYENGLQSLKEKNKYEDIVRQDIDAWFRWINDVLRFLVHDKNGEYAKYIDKFFLSNI